MFKKVGLVAKPQRRVLGYLRRAREVLEEIGVQTLAETRTAGLLKLEKGLDLDELVAEVDLLVVLGGDGTFLSVASRAVAAGVPLAGFNLGTLGFLTEMQKEKIESSLLSICRGEVKYSERKALEIEIGSRRFLALNDVVVSMASIARIITLLLEVNGSRVAEIRADGLIVSTPTGSTAYSLSAGGPIVSPEVNGLLITPICPHSLTFRTLIVPDDSLIQIGLVSSSSDTCVTIDGQTVIPMNTQENLLVRVYPVPLRMVVSPEIGYYSLLSRKLNWGI